MSLLSELLESEVSHDTAATPATFATQGAQVEQCTPESSKRSKSSKAPVLQGDTPAISAIPAIPEPECTGLPAPNSKNSKNSKAPDAKDETATRLLAVAKRERFDEQLVHDLTADELAELADFDDDTLGAHLQVLEDTARREAGRLPRGHRGAIVCRHCGPVYVDNDVARVLPVINGWPTAIGCPWCHVPNRQFPRPTVQSVTCKHWQPGEGSSYAGGACKCGTFYPKQRHRCEQYAPEGRP